MNDEEYRVRDQLGLLVKTIIIHDHEKGHLHFEKIKNIILKDIHQGFTRQPNREVDNKTGLIMHDPIGWKGLETSMRILQNIIEAIDVKLYDFDTFQILQCIEKGVDH